MQRICKDQRAQVGGFTRDCDIQQLTLLQLQHLEVMELETFCWESIDAPNSIDGTFWPPLSPPLNNLSTIFESKQMLTLNIPNVIQVTDTLVQYRGQ